MGKIVTLGEIMLRLSTPGNTRFVQSDSFDVVYGGGEANVAVSCANYGHEAYFVTKLPKHEIGQSAVNALRRYGVKTDYIARGGDRVGIYYLETGASMRPSKVIYDRAHSAIAEADPCDFDFDAIMEGADWFHWSGITPAISDKAAELTKLACEAPRSNSFLRPELPQKTVDKGKGTVYHASVDAVCRCLHRQRGRCGTLSGLQAGCGCGRRKDRCRRLQRHLHGHGQGIRLQVCDFYVA